MKQNSYPVRATGGEIRDLMQPGYYPRFKTLDQQKSWDRATRHRVTERVQKTPPVRFFSPQEAELMEAIVDRLIPQDDRARLRQIPIVPVIDERLYTNTLSGYRYEDMPPDQEAYRLALTAIDEMAWTRFDTPFLDLTVHRQELILKSLHDGQPDPPHAVWQQMPVRRLWALLLEDCVTAYYSNPWAWDEIGFGGPAYPRGYIRLENGLPEPWETDEERYEWAPPVDSISGGYRDDEGAERASTDGSEASGKG